jgi:HEAT repeat protein
MNRGSSAVIVLLLGVVLLAAQTSADETVAQLVRQLGDARFRIREEAQRRLIAQGKKAVPALRAALLGDDLEVRARARDILRRIQSSLDYLLDELKTGNASERRAAADLLGKLGKEGRVAIPVLVEMLRDNNELLREAAAMALTGIDPENRALADILPARAHVNGKYLKLLKKAKVEADLQNYGRFTDYGFYQACSWGGHNMPGGYWVYVYPHWYIWAEQKGVPAPPGVGFPPRP